MPTDSTISPNEFRSEGSSQASTRRLAADRDRRGDTDQLITNRSFDDVLASLQNEFDIRSESDKLIAPSEMFEQSKGDARTNRLDTLAKDDVQGRIKGEERYRPDFTSAKARLADRQDRPQATQLEAARGKTNLADEGGRLELDRLADGPARRQGANDGSKKPVSAPDVESQSAARRELNGDLDKQQRAPLRTAPSFSSPATEAVASAGAMASAKGTSSQTLPGQQVSPAEGVARALGVSQTAGTESARAVSNTPGNAGTQAELQQGLAKNKSSKSMTANDKTNGDAKTQSAGEASPFDKLVRSIRMQGGAKYSSATIRLDPPDLGRMRVDVRMSGDELQISVRTESQEAKQLLMGRVADLRAALEQAGIQIDRYDVSADFDASHNAQAELEYGDDSTSQKRHGVESPMAEDSDDVQWDVEESSSGSIRDSDRHYMFGAGKDARLDIKA